MKLYDISQEVFSSEVYPGDPAPEKQTLCSIAKGDLYDLTAFSMCAHNGTHVDAPRHFIEDGKTVDELSLSQTVDGHTWQSTADRFWQRMPCRCWKRQRVLSAFC